jgi:hypothetical protein
VLVIHLPRSISSFLSRATGKTLPRASDTVLPRAIFSSFLSCATETNCRVLLVHFCRVLLVQDEKRPDPVLCVCSPTGTEPIFPPFFPAPPP